MEELIYCKEEDVPLTKTRKAFIKRLLQDAPETYDSVGDVQCASGKRRSISDLHLITKSRFKRTSLNAIMRILGELHNEDNNFQLVWCSMVEKPVIRITHADKGLSFITAYSVKYNHETEGVDGYSLKMLDSMRESELNKKK